MDIEEVFICKKVPMDIEEVFICELGVEIRC